MTACKHADSGCNYPEGECLGVCMGCAPEEVKAFAIKHAPVLAEEMTRLCGAVIAKGMTGILEEVCRIQQERDQMQAALQSLMRNFPTDADLIEA